MRLSCLPVQTRSNSPWNGRCRGTNVMVAVMRLVSSRLNLHHSNNTVRCGWAFLNFSRILVFTIGLGSSKVRIKDLIEKRQNVLEHRPRWVPSNRYPANRTKN
jgi:hypothetical protein